MPALLGGYQLLERIAVGGMAEVFLARKGGPEGFEKLVALKRILPHLSRQQDFVTMFLDEARLAAQLSHANVVQVHDFGVDGDVYYMVMEHVAGQELQSVMRRSVELRRPLLLEDALHLLIGACEGLHHVHEQGIVHRDVTPSNLLVSYEGVIKVSDFGIAKLVARATQTQAGALKGKIAYMSPEQALARPVDRRSDVFSLGVCAWELLTLRRMRKDSNELKLLKEVQSGMVPRAPSLPPALEAILLKAMAPAPEDRWPSARAFGEALRRWVVELGAAPSTARLADRLRDYFGPPKKIEPPVEPTRPLFKLPAFKLSQVVHLPPLPLPRLRLLLPLLAILLSGGGLLFALRTPHIHPTVQPAPHEARVVEPPAQPRRSPARANKLRYRTTKSVNMESEGNR